MKPVVDEKFDYGTNSNVAHDLKFDKLVGEYIIEVIKLKARMVAKYGKRIEKLFITW